MRFTVFGLGEAGSLIAADLAAAGEEVRGFDPADVTTPAGRRPLRRSSARAVAEAAVVLALTASADAPTALCQALDEIPESAIYADFVDQFRGREARARGARRGARPRRSPTWR